MRPYDPTITKNSQYLKPEHTFPPNYPTATAAAHSGIRALVALYDDYVTQLQTTHIIRPIYANVNYFKQSSLANMATSLEWLRAYVGESKLVSFDIEFVPKTKVPFLALLGTTQDRTLTVDLRAYKPDRGEPAIPPQLLDFLKEHIVVGAAIRNDIRDAKIDLPAYLDVLELSNSITGHELCPWQGAFPDIDIMRKTSLKHVPELLYNEWYGCLTNEDFIDRALTYPMDHIEDWPASRKPWNLYAWKFPVRGVQMAYCRNDSMAPFIHFYVLTLFELIGSKLKVPENKEEALGMEETLVLAAIAPKIRFNSQYPEQGSLRQLVKAACQAREEALPPHVDFPNLVPAGARDDEEEDEGGWPTLDELVGDGSETMELQDEEILEQAQDGEATQAEIRGARKRQRERALESQRKQAGTVKKNKPLQKLTLEEIRKSLVVSSSSSSSSGSSSSSSSSSSGASSEGEDASEATSSPKIQIIVRRKKIEDPPQEETKPQKAAAIGDDQDEKERDRELREKAQEEKRVARQTKEQKEQEAALAALRNLRETPSGHTDQSLQARCDPSKPNISQIPVSMSRGDKPQGWVFHVKEHWRDRSSSSIRSRSYTSRNPRPGRSPSRTRGATSPRSRRRTSSPARARAVAPSSTITSAALHALEREARARKPGAFSRLGPPAVDPFPRLTSWNSNTGPQLNDSGISLERSFSSSEGNNSRPSSDLVSLPSTSVSQYRITAAASIASTGDSITEVHLNARLAKPDMGARCSFCGTSGANSHSSSDKCPHVKGFEKSHGKDRANWPNSCTYPLCESPKAHYIAMCPTLHSLCQPCGLRGHGPSACSRLDLRTIYDKFKKDGLFSKRNKEPLWQFRPPPPINRTPLLYEGKIYHVEWCTKSIADFWTRSDGEAPKGQPRSKAQRLGQGILRGFCCEECDLLMKR